MNQSGHQGLANALLFMPNNDAEQKLNKILKTDFRYNWYTVNLYCNSQECDANKSDRLSLELKLMFDLKKITQPVLIINSTVVNIKDYQKYLSAEVINTLANLTYAKS